MTKLPSADPRVTVWRDDWGRWWRAAGWALLVLGALGIVGSLLPPPAGDPPLASGELDDAMAASVVTLGLACWALWRRTITIDRHTGELRIRQGVGPASMTKKYPLNDLQQVSVTRHDRQKSRSIEFRVNAVGTGRTIRLASFYESRLFESAADAEACAGDVARTAGWEYDYTPRGFSPSELHR